MIELELKIIDAATPFLNYMAQTKPDWMRKSLKSAGWWMGQEIKKGIRSGAPGGQKYIERMSNQRRQDIDDIMASKNANRKPQRSYPIMGDLPKSVGYQYSESSVLVGYLSKGAVRIGQWQENGVTQTVTDKMRRLMFGADIGLQQGRNFIITPARPTFAPMKRALEPKIADYIETKIINYMQKGTGWEPSTKTRKYRVRG